MKYLVVRQLTPRLTMLIAFATSAFLLAGAHLFERVGGLAPCLLCLEQREVHWTAAIIAVVSYAAALALRTEKALAAGLGALALTYLFSAWIAGFHAGVEWGFWPGPDACAAGGAAAGSGVTGDDILASINAPGPNGPPCSVAAWRMFGISMAGYNALISLALSGLCAIACFSAWRLNFAATAPKGRIA